MSGKRLVFIVGAHGKIGQKLVKKLSSPESKLLFQTIPLVRKSEQLQKFKDLGFEPQLFDVAKTDVPGIIEGLLKPHKADTVPATVVFSAGAAGSGDGNIINIDLDGPVKFVEAIESYNRKIQFVIVSALFSLHREFWFDTSLKNYYIGKRLADEFILHSKLDNYVILQPGALLDGENGTGKIKTQEEIPSVKDAKSDSSGKETAIYRDDVAKFIVAVLKDKDNSYNKKIVPLSNGTHPIA